MDLFAKGDYWDCLDFEGKVKYAEHKIGMALKDLASWEKREAEARQNKEYKGEVLFFYIRSCKKRRKEAQANLKYWQQIQQDLKAELANQ